MECLIQTTISQIVQQRTFGTCQLLMLLSCLMLVHWTIVLLSIQAVIMIVLGVLYWWTIHSITLQWLITLVWLQDPELVLSVVKAVGVSQILLLLLRGPAGMMVHGLKVPSHVVSDLGLAPRVTGLWVVCVYNIYFILCEVISASVIQVYVFLCMCNITNIGGGMHLRIGRHMTTTMQQLEHVPPSPT